MSTHIDTGKTEIPLGISAYKKPDGATGSSYAAEAKKLDHGIFFRKYLESDLASREAGYALFDSAFSGSALFTFICRGLRMTDQQLAIDVSLLGGMAGEW